MFHMVWKMDTEHIQSNDIICVFSSLPPTNNFEPLEISFTASSAVEQNTGFSRHVVVEKRRFLSILRLLSFEAIACK